MGEKEERKGKKKGEKWGKRRQDKKPSCC